MKRENVRTNQYRSEVLVGMAWHVITFVAERLIRYRLVNKSHQIFIIFFLLNDIQSQVQVIPQYTLFLIGSDSGYLKYGFSFVGYHLNFLSTFLKLHVLYFGQ